VIGGDATAVQRPVNRRRQNNSCVDLNYAAHSAASNTTHHPQPAAGLSDNPRLRPEVAVQGGTTPVTGNDVRTNPSAQTSRTRLVADRDRLQSPQVSVSSSGAALTHAVLDRK